MKQARLVVAGAVLLAALGAIALRTCAASPPHEAAGDVRPPEAQPGPQVAAAAAKVPRARAEEPAVAAPEVKPAETGSIVGVALRTDGKPAAGAKVRAAAGGDELKRVVVQAGDDGAFRFPALAPGRWTVACTGGGFGTRLDRGAEAPVADVVAGAEVRVEVRGEALAVVTGHVAGPDGKPVADARVQAQCGAFLYQSGAWRLDTKTKEDGAYEFANVTPGDFVGVFFSADGLASQERKLRDLQPGSRTVVDVALERAVPVEIVLVAADDGSPVREAYVWIHDLESGLLYDGGHGDSVAPDADGRVRATMLRPRPAAVQIDAKGFVRVPDTQFDPRTLQGPLTIRLVRAISISGRLVRADGTGVAGEWVRAAPAGSTDWLALARADCQGVSGADGAFRIEGLRAGRYRVGVTSSTGEEIVATEADAGATDVVLRMEGEPLVRRVRVRVVGPDGQVVAKAKIRTGRMSGGSPTSFGGGGMHQKGEDFVEVPRAADEEAFIEVWDVRDEHGARLPLGHVLAIVPRDATDGWTLELAPERVVEGRVVGPDGEAVEGADIAVVPLPGPGFTEGILEEIVGTKSGAKGAFRIVGLGDERVRLTASAEGFVGVAMDGPAGATGVVLRLAREVPAAIRVVDTEGKPVPEAGVIASPVGGDDDRPLSTYVQAMTDADGRARLRGLFPGTRYRLAVSVPGTRRDLYSFEDPDWSPRDAEIRLGHAYVISGVVHDEAEKDVAPFERVVEITRDGKSVETALVEEGGRFRAILREPGRYVLTVFAREGKRVLASAEAEADGDPVTLEVRGR